MRALIQRVKYASVSSNDSLIGSIGIGLTVFIGIGRNDTIETANYIINKVLNLRLFSKEDNPLALSVDEIHGGLLIVSQFTLYAEIKKGRRPSFIAASNASDAIGLYDYVVHEFSKSNCSLVSGIFGSEMIVDIKNDGPFTLWIDSDN
ncbi:MAG: D-tyrosyl-tRNA(Tyr) deacylase [Chloroflexi bacterium]|nr:D-tyrosyl-tRNA(Tyr) deacylase [Chloroflexota bacterium]|tara:strand:- start:22904 stop:23347 length:444 start_codon:yes stop_codon:yes gene_type:complete